MMRGDEAEAFELLIRLFEVGHRGFELVEPHARLGGQPPLLAQRARELYDLHRVERLLQDQKPIGDSELPCDFVARVVRVGGAEHDLQTRVDLQIRETVSRPSQPGGIRMSTNATAYG